jgi:hypothetical protein
MRAASLWIDDLRFELRRSDRRETVGLTVERDGSLVLYAPSDLEVESVIDAVRSRQEWVYTKLAEKELLLRPQPPKRYVTGETHYYLGRNYRLLIERHPTPDDPALRLLAGRFVLRDDARDKADLYFTDWYVSAGQRWLTNRVRRWASRVGVTPGPIDVRDLGYRWGSCGAGTLNFHWRTMTLPPRAIDYVIVHELAHIAEPHHSGAFWDRVRQALPDFGSRKRWLAEHGGEF